MKILILFLMTATAFASYSPQTIITDANTGATANVNSSSELDIFLGSDSNVCKETGGNLASILATLEAPLTVSQRYLNSGTDSVTIAGSIVASNPSVGSVPSPVPSFATLVGGKDPSGNLQAIALNSSNAQKVDGSGVIQPVSAPSSSPVYVSVVNPAPAPSPTLTVVVAGPSPLPVTMVSPIPSQTVTVSNPFNGVITNPTSSPVPVSAPSTSPVYVNVVNQPVPSPTVTVVVASPIPSQTVTVSNPYNGVITNPTASPVPVSLIAPSPVPVSAPSASPVYVNVVNQPVPSPTITVVVASPIPSQSVTVTNPYNGVITNSSSSPVPVANVSPIPSGSNTIGAVNQAGAPWSTNQTQIGGSAISLGQKAAASSLPVVTQADNSYATQVISTIDGGSTTTPYANGQNFITGTPTTNSAASFAFASFEAAEIQVTGGFTGSLSTEISFDGGTTWFTRGVKQAGASYISSSFTQPFQGGMNTSGATNVRVRATAAMTGAATVLVVGSTHSASVAVTNPLTLRDASVQSTTNTIKIGNSTALAGDTALVVALSPNSNSVTQGTPAPVASPWPVSVTSVSNIATYTACYNDLTVPAAPTDIFYITGSSTKTVTVLSIDLSGTRGTVLMTEWDYLLRSSADSGGSCSAATNVPHDANNVAATASVQGCTTSPTTLGTLVGTVFNRKFVIPATTGVDSDWPQIANFGGPGEGQGIVLRGTSQLLAINPANTAIASGIINMCVTWTEQ